MKNISSLTFLLIALLYTSCYYDNKEDLYQYVQDQDCQIVDATYQTDILPIMINHCNQCHRDARKDGGVNLEGYNNVKLYADNGQLYGTTNHDSGYKVMPTSGVKIPFCEIEKMRIWIANGALNN